MRTNVRAVALGLVAFGLSTLALHAQDRQAFEERREAILQEIETLLESRPDDIQGLTRLKALLEEITSTLERLPQDPSRGGGGAGGDGGDPTANGAPTASDAPKNVPGAPPGPKGKPCPKCGRPLPDWSDSFGRNFCENPSCSYGKADPDHGTCSECGTKLQWSNGRTFCPNPKCNAGVPDDPPGENGQYGNTGTAKEETPPPPKWEYHTKGRDRADMRVNNPDGGYTLYQVWGGTVWDPSWDWAVWTYDSAGNLVSEQKGGKWSDGHRPSFPSKPW